MHASVDWGAKEKNLAWLLDLNEEAAAAGAKIIVNTELATTGYSFACREEIATLVETIPGPTTRKFGPIAEKYGCYIAIGLPEVDPRTGIFYNAAALVGPAGQIAGRCRKLAPAYRENLWAARGNLPVLVVQTEFGRVGLVVCADTYSYKPARVAALKGARILLVPAVWPPEHHDPEKFWRARATENGLHLLVCNRTGIDRDLDCSAATSYIIDGSGAIVKQVSSPAAAIIYGTLPLAGGKVTGVSPAENLSRRRPSLYSDISLDTYFLFNPVPMLGLPQVGEFTIAAVQYRPLPGRVADNVEKLLGLVDQAVDKAAAAGTPLDIAVLPELSTTGIIAGRRAAEAGSEEIPGPITDRFAQKAAAKNIFIVLGLAERGGGCFYNSVVLVGPRGLAGRYRKVHLSRQDGNWATAGDNVFPFFDLPFARLGLLAGDDLLFPESAESLAKRGTDLICTPAAWTNSKMCFIWEARMGEQAHLVVANQWGERAGEVPTGRSAIYGYSRFQEKLLRVGAGTQGNDIIIQRLDSRHTREKRFLENIDYDTLLKTNAGRE